MKYITLLYNKELPKDVEAGKDTSGSEWFNIEEHEDLKSAVKYLVKHGARYDEQAIVTEVDWMPDGKVIPQQPQKAILHPVDDSFEPPKVDPNVPVEQPQTLDFTNPSGDNRPPSVSERLNGVGGKHSIFDKILPPQLIQQIHAD